MAKQDFDMMERSYERKKLLLTEDFLRIIKLKEETYARLIEQLRVYKSQSGEKYVIP